MNLFELNARLAVKLGQSFDTLYEMEYMEYSYILNIVKKDIDEKNEKILKEADDSTKLMPHVSLPDHLRLK